jgi:hypothetical protein
MSARSWTFIRNYDSDQSHGSVLDKGVGRKMNCTYGAYWGEVGVRSELTAAHCSSESAPVLWSHATAERTPEHRQPRECLRCFTNTSDMRRDALRSPVRLGAIPALSAYPIHQRESGRTC